MYRYFEVDDNFIVTCIISTHNKIQGSNVFILEDKDIDILNRIYNVDTKSFSYDKYIYDKEKKIVSIKEYNEPIDSIANITQILADLTEIVLLGGGV